jgi:uncharacterized membrane protein YhaH (DUF805 family)
MKWYLMVLQKYAVFTGRARRKEYWMFFLFNMIASFLVGIISGIMMGTGSTDFDYLGTLYSVAVLLPSIAVGVRRMHDVGKSGWFILIPIYNLILAVTEGNSGPNEYGADPKGDNADHATNNELLDNDFLN